MEDNNRKNYSGDEQSMNQRNSTGDQFEQDSSEKARPSYYYSYGPYKSAFQEKENEQTENVTTSVTGSGGTSSVEVTAPRTLRPFSFQANSNQTAPAAQRPSGQKRSSFRSVFSAFLAGASGRKLNVRF